MQDTSYIKTSLDEDGSGLITSHYIDEVLPETKQFKQFHCNRLTAWVDGADGQAPLSQVFASSKGLNERQMEDALIRPILEMLDNKLVAQVGLGGDTMDFCVYDGDAYDNDYTNTNAIVESKRYGRIEAKYYIRKQDNSDEVYQALNYLRTINLHLNKKGSSHNVDYVILTDGCRFNHKGERKATGSYYTPDLIVEHLVHTDLDPKLDAIKAAHGQSFGSVYEAVLDLKLCEIKTKHEYNSTIAPAGVSLAA